MQCQLKILLIFLRLNWLRQRSLSTFPLQFPCWLKRLKKNKNTHTLYLGRMLYDSQHNPPLFTQTDCAPFAPEDCKADCTRLAQYLISGVSSKVISLRRLWRLFEPASQSIYGRLHSRCEVHRKLSLVQTAGGNRNLIAFLRGNYCIFFFKFVCCIW